MLSEKDTKDLLLWFGYDIVSQVTNTPKTTLWQKYNTLFENKRQFDTLKEHKHLRINETLASDLLIDFCQPALMSLFDANKHKRVLRCFTIGIYRNLRNNTIKGIVFKGLENAHKVECLIIKALKEDREIKVVESDPRYHKAILRYGLTPKYIGKNRQKPYVTKIEQPIGIFQKVIQNNASKVKNCEDIETLLNGIVKVVYEKDATDFLKCVAKYRETKEEVTQVRMEKPLEIVI